MMDVTRPSAAHTRKHRSTYNIYEFFEEFGTKISDHLATIEARVLHVFF